MYTLRENSGNQGLSNLCLSDGNFHGIRKVAFDDKIGKALTLMKSKVSKIEKQFTL